jgi:hypothetical protein
MFEHELDTASAHAAAAPEIQAELSARRTQLQRVQGARREATAAGDTRRAARLDVRAQRIEGEIERDQFALNAARRTVAEGERARRRSGRAHTPEQARERSRLLDEQAALPDLRSVAAAREGAGAGDRSGAGPQRDYAALASLAGFGREQYERLDPRARREARLEIDRELALRRDARQGQSGHATPRSSIGARHERSPRNGPPHHARQHQRGHRPAGVRESPVMRDAREVAQRRKRQLGGQ